MKNDNLEQWLPCQSYCQMNGAAAAVLSFKNTTVVLNGPSWCSLVVERELMSYNRTLQHRLYCSHVEQADLLFGTGDRIREILDVQKQENPDAGLLAVAREAHKPGVDRVGHLKHVDLARQSEFHHQACAVSICAAS